MSPPFEFVTVDPATNPKPGKSLQIRSRCVQGKNKREGSRRSLQEKRKRAKEEEIALQRAHDQATAKLPPLQKPPIGSLEMIHFADPSLGPEDKGLVLRAFAYDVANLDLSTLGRWLDFGTVDSVPFEWLFSDSTFLHTILCASYAVSDFTAAGWDGKPGQKTLFHLRESLSLLQKKMQNRNVHTDESVLHVVINLALLAAMFGDFEAAAVHYKGLQKIVQLRGNVDFLVTRPKLHFKLDRIDLAFSFSSGKKPFFLHPTVLWESLIPAQYLPPLGIYAPPSYWDVKLQNVFQDLQYLSSIINRAVRERARYGSPYLQGIMTSLQSRLVHLADYLEDPVEEMIRFAMLAFLTTTFKAPGPKIPYDWAEAQLREGYASADSMYGQDMCLQIWAIIIIAITVKDGDLSWVKRQWTAIGLGLSWDVVKDYLVQVMWIDAIHDNSGEIAYQRLADVCFGNDIVEI